MENTMTIVTTLKPDFNVPKLDIDALMYGECQVKPSHFKVERRIIYNLGLHLEANGFVIAEVFDGDEFIAVKSIKGAMEVCFSLDEASLRVRQINVAGGPEHGIEVIFGNGNNGMDLISDWSYSVDDADGFNAVMDAFDVEQFA
jgi:hypothetical protein